jgi:hypothetical protein
MDVEGQCPRRDELARLRHEESVQRHKARAAARLAEPDTSEITTDVISCLMDEHDDEVSEKEGLFQRHKLRGFCRADAWSAVVD